jgi:hypothetical protein
MPYIVYQIVEIFDPSSYATIDSQNVRGTTLLVDNFDSASLAELGEGNEYNLGKRNQGTIISTTGSINEPPKYYVYIQTSSGDQNFSGSEWTNLSNWAELITTDTDLTASFVTGSNVYGPFGSNSILSSSYAETASYVLIAQTASYVSADNIDQPFTTLTASSNVSFSGILSIPGFPNVATTLATLTAGGSDNLGNHTAEEDLNLANFNIISASNISSSGHISASEFIGNLSGSVYGTSSWANKAVSASYSTTASYALSASNAFSSSYSISSSYALSASSAFNSVTASYILNAISASYSDTASYILNAISASYSDTASYVLNAISASHATTASFVISASHSNTASYIKTAQTASYVDVTSATQGVITIGGENTTINSLGVGGSPEFVNVTVTTGLTSDGFVSASGKLFASLSYDNTPIAEEKGGVVVYDTASGQFYYTGSYIGITDTSDTASYITASNVHGPYGTSSIESSSFAVTASYILNSVSASYSDTASYVLNAISASHSNTASYVLNAISASHSNTASYIKNAQTASYVNVTSATQGIITIGGEDTTINSLGTDGTPEFVTVTVETGLTSDGFVSASGKLFASLSYDDTPITNVSGGVVVYDSSSGQFYYTGSYIGEVDTSNTASYVTASNVHGPYGTSSIESASFAVTASYILNAISASYSDTASYVLNAVSASYSDTASFALSASLSQTSSYIKNAQTASYISLNSSTQGQIIVGGETTNIDSLTTGGTPEFVTVTGTTGLVSDGFVSASGKLFASLSYDNTPITHVSGGVVVYDSSSGQFYYTGSYVGELDTANTASFVTASDVHGPYGTSSIESASFAVTASYILNSISASYSDTASYVLNAISASYSDTASYVLNSISASHSNTASYIKNAQTASYVNVTSVAQGIITIGGEDTTVNSLGTGGTPEFETVTVTTGLTSDGFISASGELFASLSYDDTPLTHVSGGVVVYDSSSGQFYYTGSYIGELDTANTASFVTASNVHGPYGTSSIESASFAITASYILNAVSASYSDTASYVLNAVSASYSSTASYVLNAISASYSDTASYIKNAQTASYVNVTSTTQGVITIGGENTTINSLGVGGTPEFETISAATGIDSDGYISASGKLVGLSVSSSYVSSSIISSSKYWGLSASYDVLSLNDFPNVSASIAQLIAGGITDIVQDTTPQLGGNLDLNEFNISGSGAISASSGFYGTASWAETSSIALTASYIDATNVDQPFYNLRASNDITADRDITAVRFINGNRVQVDSTVEFRNSFNKLYIGADGITGATTVTNLSFPVGAGAQFDLLGDTMLNLNIGAGAANVNIGAATSQTTIADDLSVLGDTEMNGDLTVTTGNTVTAPEFIGDLTGTADTASYVEADNIDQPFSSITSSGDISSSGDGTFDIIRTNAIFDLNPAGDFNIDTSGVATFSGLAVNGNVYLRGNTHEYGNASTDTHTFTGNITASGNISASGTVYADAFQSATGGNSIEFNDSLNLTGNITASGNISASGNLTTTEITASGDISASGTVFANLTTGTDNSVVVYTDTGELKTDEVDSKVFGTKLVDYHVSTTANSLVSFRDTTGTIQDIGYGLARNVSIKHRVRTTSPDELELAKDQGFYLRLKTADSSPEVNQFLGGISFSGYQISGDKFATIEGYTTDIHENAGNISRGTEMRFNVTPSGSTSIQQILKLNADSGSLFSGSVRADRFVTRQNEREVGVDTVPTIGENFHGNVETGVLLLTGSIAADKTWDVELFKTPVTNHSVDFSLNIKLTLTDNSVIVVNVKDVCAMWDDTQADLTVPGTGNQYIFPTTTRTFPLTNYIGGVSEDAVVSNIILTGPAGGNITVKWVSSGNVTKDIENAQYETVVKYNVNKF